MVDDQTDESTQLAIKEKYGLNQPIHLQYLQYLNGISPIGFQTITGKENAHNRLGAFSIKAPDFGRSFQSNQKINELLVPRLKGTLILALSAIVFAGFFGILLGLFAALYQDTLIDRSILSASLLGISAPSFFTGVLIAWIFAIYLHDWTNFNITGYLWEYDPLTGNSILIPKNLILPALTLGIRPLAVFIQLTRSSVLEILMADYVRTAKAKGLNRFTVLFKHILQNALNPVLSSITGWLASLLAGAFFIEYIFNWHGIGKLTIDALNTNDFPVILACSITIGTIFVIVNIITDFLYAILDPRIRIH